MLPNDFEVKFFDLLSMGFHSWEDPSAIREKKCLFRYLISVGNYMNEGWRAVNAVNLDVWRERIPVRTIKSTL